MSSKEERKGNNWPRERKGKRREWNKREAVYWRRVS
jgi:hypothetical protein